VYKNEGFLGFYRGLPPQLLGVAPEKAIKLTMNDLIRGRATDPETGKIKLGWEVVAGAVAGASQVVSGMTRIKVFTSLISFNNDIGFYKSSRK